MRCNGFGRSFVLAAAAVAALTVPGGSAGAFTAVGMAYTCFDSEEASPNAPAFAWDDISATGTPTGLAQDDQFINVAIPFPFTYAGTAQAFANVCSNGFVNFGAGSTAWGNGVIPAAGAPNNAIYAWWDDMYLPLGGDVRTATIGTAPDRRFVVSWTNVPHRDNLFTPGSGNMTFQIALYENGSAIRIQYDAMTGTRGNGNSATVGIEDAFGAQALSYNASNNNPLNATYESLAVGFFVTGTTPPWAPPVEPPPAAPGGDEDESRVSDTENYDSRVDELKGENCASGSASSGAWLAIASSLALGLALMRRS